MTQSPLVSIVTATYNRSDVLAYAIRSVRSQTLEDWELIVVGDACTDDTAEVVASFSDPRIRFHNLDVNVGEQSGPNNEGCRQARGRYVAYLNHDDLWLPHHLETMVEQIERTGADLVFALMCIVRRDGPNVLGCATPTGRYEPYVTVPASAWLFRRELLDEVGPWTFYQDCYNMPSQEWLYRARQAGKTLELVPRLGVVAIPSGMRPGSYAKREVDEHQRNFERLSDPTGFVERELTAMAIAHAAWDPHVRANLAVRLYVVAALKNLARRLIGLINPDLAAGRLLLRGLRRGHFVDEFREVRGLPRLERRPSRRVRS